MAVTSNTPQQLRTTGRSDVEGLRAARGILLGFVGALSVWLLVALAVLFAVRLI